MWRKLAPLASLALSVVLSGGTASCSRGCGDTQIDCFEPHVRVFSFERADAASTTICVNEKCKTYASEASVEAFFSLAEHEIAWQPGTNLDISLGVVDSHGRQLASLHESRTMTTTHCDCPAFWYRLDGTELRRA